MTGGSTITFRSNRTPGITFRALYSGGTRVTGITCVAGMARVASTACITCMACMASKACKTGKAGRPFGASGRTSGNPYNAFIRCSATIIVLLPTHNIYILH